MADNVTLPGTGAVVATKDVSGVQTQIVNVNEFPASSKTTDTVGATTDVLVVADGVTALTVKFASISTASSGYTSLVSAVTGKKIRVLSYAIVASAAVTVQFASASTAKSGAMSLDANGGVSAQAQQGLFETASAEALRLNLGGAVQVSGHLSYVEV